MLSALGNPEDCDLNLQLACSAFLHKELKRDFRSVMTDLRLDPDAQYLESLVIWLGLAKKASASLPEIKFSIRKQDGIRSIRKRLKLQMNEQELQHWQAPSHVVLVPTKGIDIWGNKLVVGWEDLNHFQVQWGSDQIKDWKDGETSILAHISTRYIGLIHKSNV